VTVTPPTPTPVGKDRPRIGLVVLWLAALVVVVLGVWSLVDALVWNNEVVDYANGHRQATYVAQIGGRAVRAGDALCGCDDRSLALQRQAQEALANGDVAAFNALADQINTEAANGNDALRRLDAAVASLP
jgi:hypothetical protein